ncbi:CLUMA_CG004870, isoform A [Clunio marinus]|uniref:CLUMA_CG004870, isoform A n=1 Tax=Clunio marinus TaxID=568069 RepID=A0A1J1HT63_9DIPT|nr:CLUMA_CG004870, isoform A [Clunio marinus]
MCSYLMHISIPHKFSVFKVFFSDHKVIDRTNKGNKTVPQLSDVRDADDIFIRVALIDSSSLLP